MGDYLFTDQDYVARLLADDRSTFQRIWDEIKYFLKIVTPGSSEEKQLLKAQHAFQEAYRANSQALGNESGEVRHSIAKTRHIPYEEQLRQIEKGNMNGSDSLHIGKPSDQLQKAGFSAAPFAMNQSDYRKSRRKAGNNKRYSSHNVPYAFFEKMPQLMADAPMFIDNGAKVTVITSYAMQDTRGNDSYVIAGVWKDQKMEGDTVNLVKSVYPWDDFTDRLRNAASAGKVIITNKNKAEQMLASIGVQPSELSSIIDLARNSLSQDTANVKQYSLDGETPGGAAVAAEDDIAPPVSGEKITMEEAQAIQGIGRKSVNEFNAKEIGQLEKFAKKYWANMGTTSPFFRAWLGDWRAYDTTRVKSIPVNADFVDISDIPRGSFYNDDTGWNITSTRDGIDETANKKGVGSAEHQSLADLDNMLKNAILLDTVIASEPSKRMGKSTVLVHHLYCPISRNGKSAIAKLYVTENIQGKHRFYLTKIEEVTHAMGNTAKTGSDAPRAKRTAGDTSSAMSVAEIFAFVKEHDVDYEADSATSRSC